MKRRRNIQDHGIDFADLEGFFDGDLLTREDTREAYLTLFQPERRKAMKHKAGHGTTRKAVSDKTAWAKLAAMHDRDIKFTKDAPRAAPSDWANAIAHRGLPLPSRKAQIALRVDEDVLAWFRAQGAGYQTRMNAVLKAFRDAHKS